MQIEAQLTDDAVLAELGERIASLRLARDITQQALSARAGVGRTVLQRIEAGEPVTTTNLVRVLRALDALDGLDRLLPPSAPSPLAQLRLRGRARLRASGAHTRRSDPPGGREQPWHWGDER